MNRGRQQRTPAAAASDGVLASQDVVLGSELPNADTQAGEGRRVAMVMYHDADNYVAFDVEAGTIEFMVKGKLLKPRPTAICVNGSEQMVTVLRSALDGES